MESREQRIVSMVIDEYDVIEDPPYSQPIPGVSTVNEDVVQHPAGEQPAGEPSLGKQSVGKKSVGEQSVIKQSVGERAIDKQSVGEQSVSKQAVCEQAVSKQPAGGIGEQSLGEQQEKSIEDKTDSGPDPSVVNVSKVKSGQLGHNQNPHPQVKDQDGVKSTSRTPQEEDGTMYELLCPRVNCPEKIVICLDFSSEMDKPMFRTRAGDKFAPLKLVKRALGFYVHSKHRMDSRHEFALILLQDSAIWVKDFTNDPRELVNLLEDLEDTGGCESCDLSTVFQSIYERVVMPTVEGDPLVLPPPYIVRLLMIYGRSHCTLEIPHKEAQRALFSSPYFFVDAFYIHEASSEENKCEEIFDSLCDLDYKGFSYIFEASRNPTKIYDFMAQLLAHPLQRPGQKDTAYKLRPRIPAEQ
ncbi:BRISC and BRCA1-A complex member 1-like [Liolophura sinensis]|uniref:BRISC and BRCA1-A complex member 1-like n=1 Tax=Liolophura sinensis TaxID=3198878 RepID=UPI003158EA9E